MITHNAPGFCHSAVTVQKGGLRRGGGQRYSVPLCVCCRCLKPLGHAIARASYRCFCEPMHVARMSATLPSTETASATAWYFSSIRPGSFLSSSWKAMAVLPVPVARFEVAFQIISQYFLGLAKRLPISPRINWLLYDSPDINCFC